MVERSSPDSTRAALELAIQRALMDDDSYGVGCDDQDDLEAAASFSATFIANAIASLPDAAAGAIDPILPCDVALPNNLFIRKGCKLSTLVHALERRGMQATGPADVAQPPAEPGMQAAVQYRRKDGGYGPGWITMAMFDGTLAAEAYCSQQRTDDKWPFEYRAVELTACSVSSTEGK
jgi:hypothetical protein